MHDEDDGDRAGRAGGFQFTERARGLSVQTAGAEEIAQMQRRLRQGATPVAEGAVLALPAVWMTAATAAPVRALLRFQLHHEDAHQDVAIRYNWDSDVPGVPGTLTDPSGVARLEIQMQAEDGEHREERAFSFELPRLLSILAAASEDGHLALYPQRPVDEDQMRLGLVLTFEDERAGDTGDVMDVGGLAAILAAYQALGFLEGGLPE